MKISKRDDGIYELEAESTREAETLEDRHGTENTHHRNGRAGSGSGVGVMPELKPCPFCGGEPVLESYSGNDGSWGQACEPAWAYINCMKDGCGANGPKFFAWWQEHKDDAKGVAVDKAIEAWNTRTEETA